MEHVGLRKDTRYKIAVSTSYNYIFDKVNGRFWRWGTTKDDDPIFAPMPELLDIEISEICTGHCPWCYKSNISNGRNMSLETFGQILDLFLPFMTQVALGIGDANTNPDLVPIMKHCREEGVVPNLTLTGIGLTNELANELASLAGAISVSVYPHTIEKAYSTILWLQDLGLEQVNIHLIVAKETLDHTYQVISDVNDFDWLNPNAVVLLALKQKGRGVGLTSITQTEFKDLVDHCIGSIPLGFDSCSASSFLDAVGSREYDLYVEPCESGLFSYYVNVAGMGFPCSFAEGEVPGVNLLNVKDFSKEVWNNATTSQWRETLLANGRRCPIYDIYGR